jgi:hypothetical protein
MEKSVPHIDAFLIIYWDWVDDLAGCNNPRCPPSLAGILTERLLQCKASAAQKASGFGSTKVALTQA